MSKTSDGAHDALLLEAMTDLVNRSKLDVDGYMQKQGNRDAHELANIVHDKLVEVWTKPQHDSDDLQEPLRQKADVWERHRRNQTPRSSQLERASTPRRTPGVPQVLPDTIEKPLVGSASAPRVAWDSPGGWNTANQQEREWSNTNTIG